MNEADFTLCSKFHGLSVDGQPSGLMMNRPLCIGLYDVNRDLFHNPPRNWYKMGGELHTLFVATISNLSKEPSPMSKNLKLSAAMLAGLAASLSVVAAAPFRQGDVLLSPLSSMPDGLSIEAAGNEGNRCVIKWGEVTGHAHALYSSASPVQAWEPAPALTEGAADEVVQAFMARIMSRNAVVLNDDAGHRFLLIKEARHSNPTVTGPVTKEDATSFAVQTTLGEVMFPKALYSVVGDKVEGPAFEIISHEEHTPQAVPNGFYGAPEQQQFEHGLLQNVAD